MSLENDITGLMEKDVFKSASQEEVEKRKEAYRKEIEAKRKAGVDLCPECGEDLHEVGIYSRESVADQVVRTYEWNVETKKWDETDVSRDEDEGQNDREEWHCGECDGDLVEGTDFSMLESVKETHDVFVPASKEEYAVRKAEGEKREAEEFERERIKRKQERESGEYILNNMDTSRRGTRHCVVCGETLPMGEKYVSGWAYGRRPVAICKHCITSASTRL